MRDRDRSRSVSRRYGSQRPFGSYSQPAFRSTLATLRHRPFGSKMQPAFAVTRTPPWPPGAGSVRRPRRAPLETEIDPVFPQAAENEPHSRPSNDDTSPSSPHEAARAADGLTTDRNRHSTRAGTNGRNVGFNMTVLLAPRKCVASCHAFRRKIRTFPVKPS